MTLMLLCRPTYAVLSNNGQQDDGEPIHIFWIDLKDPSKTGRQY